MSEASAQEGGAVRSTAEDGSQLPSGGMPDSDPLASSGLRAALPGLDDPEVQLFRAQMLARLLDEEHEPSRIGRFKLLEKVAEGGMGIVYAAYDGDLDRKVAVKVIKRELESEAVRTRIVREAQAMAKLSHPNVAQVYEVGEHRASTFIAMEFVRGVTLRKWQTASGRSWREIVATYLQAARGLAAAHAVGLVHRDFKADNAIVADDGRVRVLDFGLARADAPERAHETALPAPEVDALGTPLTKTGSLMGTLGYMAPEQLFGESTDAKADQFAFCVSLWEALYGERPFAGATRVELVANVTQGRIREPPKEAKVPVWIHGVLVRGLAIGQADRFASIDALVEALEADPTRRRKRLLVATAVLAVGGLAVGGWTLDRQRRTQACTEAGASIDEVWNDEHRVAVREGLVATGAGHAATTAEKIMPWLDAQADAWREARTEACLDADVRDRWGADMLERSVWCLDDRRLELAALVTELEDADLETVTRAVTAATDLRQVQPCRDEALLSRLPAPPTEAHEAVQEVRAELSRARAMRATGAYADGLAVATQALEEAEAVEWPPLVAAARLSVGALLGDTGKYADAESMHERAYFEAARAGALEEALAAADALVFAVGCRLGRAADGERWAQHADVVRSALPDPAGLREAASLDNLALVRDAAGSYAEAAKLFERSLVIWERALGPDHRDVATGLTNLGNVHTKAGAYEEAARLYERALSIGENTLGPEHPDVAERLVNLAAARAASGAYEEAARLLERALHILENTVGPEHATMATALTNAGYLHKKLGEYEEAARLLERALAIQEKAVGRDHRGVATILGLLAGVRTTAGAHEEAAKLRERVLAIEENALGPDHPDVAASCNDLATVYSATGAHDEAARLFARAIAIREKALGPDHLLVVNPLLGLAQLEVGRGRAAEAVPLAERAVKVAEAGDAPAKELAKARFVLARALVTAGESKARAVVLATQARDAYREAGEAHRQALAEAEAFLREHDPDR